MARNPAWQAPENSLQANIARPLPPAAVVWELLAGVPFGERALAFVVTSGDMGLTQASAGENSREKASGCCAGRTLPRFVRVALAVKE